ncbi:uncharacterized protein LOC126817142 isoform X4 [Patella vulgata]|uniref:uncharacterized protein LOC126817142 isoform X4 n=1 Tax=Patella vulgata TaxID=6465 RepID=UPI0021800E8E|nr:uncharacterized protein LOC126817142 isoform X4 [Patella vulgata]
MSVDRQRFEAFLGELVKGQRSKVITRQKGEIVMRYLKGGLTDDLKEYNTPRFGYYIRNKGFEILQTEIDADDEVKEYLYQRVYEHGTKRLKIRPVDDESTVFRRVAFTDDFYDILCQFHKHEPGEENQTMGYKRCLKAIQDVYSLFPRSCVQTFCNMCTICQEARQHPPNNRVLPIPSSHSFSKSPMLAPKKRKCTPKKSPSNRKMNLSDVLVQNSELPRSAFSSLARTFMDRCQVEIVEMEDMDQHYLYIGHFMDYYSNYHVLFPLINSSPTAIVQGLSNNVFAYFGIPKVLMSSRGNNFLSEVIEKIHKDWPNRGSCSMGVVTSATARLHNISNSEESDIKDIFKILAAENMVNEKHVPWVRWIPLAQYRLNTQVKVLNEKTPYQVIFKQLPRSISLYKTPDENEDSVIMSINTVAGEDVTDHSLLREVGQHVELESS